MIISRIRQFTRAYDQAQRFRTIVAVFLKYGYNDLADRLPLPRLVRWLPGRHFRLRHAELMELSPPVRLRRAFEELGPAFVKLGQMLAGRTRLLPRAYTEELAKLHDQVPPVPRAEVVATLTEELRRPWTACFAEFDPEPLGSASIAQVHTARLPNGTSVVVKVQRPDIERNVQLDLEIMARLAELIEHHLPEWQVHQPTAIVAEFARRMELELDFSAELAAMERFAFQSRDDRRVRVPQVFREFSTRRLLTMERITGIPATEVRELTAAGLDRVEIARRLADLTLQQIFVHGFFHGDPHPGNVHVLPGNVVCFLDFGLTGFLVRETRDSLAALFAAIAQRDERVATHALLLLASAELDPPRPGLEVDVAEFIHRHFGGAVRELVFMRLLQNLFKLTARHHLTLPPEIFLVVKALGQVEHLMRELAPDLDLLEQARPFMRELHVRRSGPRRLVRELLDFGSEAALALRTLPLEFRRVAAQVREGKARVNFHHEGLRPLNLTLERVSNRLSFAVVLAALLLASSVVIHAGIQPQWHGISVIGLVGYAFAFCIGAALLISMIRRGQP